MWRPCECQALQVRTGMRQHEAEFLSRKAEDEAKIAQGQEQLETLTRELGLLRQRHLQEATEVRHGGRTRHRSAVALVTARKRKRRPSQFRTTFGEADRR